MCRGHSRPSASSIGGIHGSLAHFEILVWCGTASPVRLRHGRRRAGGPGRFFFGCCGCGGAGRTARPPGAGGRGRRSGTGGASPSARCLRRGAFGRRRGRGCRSGGSRQAMPDRGRLQRRLVHPDAGRQAVHHALRQRVSAGMGVCPAPGQPAGRGVPVLTEVHQPLPALPGERGLYTCRPFHGRDMRRDGGVGQLLQRSVRRRGRVSGRIHVLAGIGRGG